MGEVPGVNGAQSTVQPVKITIKKNQGITQALFDLVKNENLSGGKIDAGEWKNALSVLNEIQANREKTGGANIYTGGAGNDSHKNYIVQEGQQIEFTAKEIQKLYNALGVTLKDGRSPQPAHDTTGADQAGQAGGVGEVKQTPSKTETPKSQIPKDAKKSDCPGVLYSESADKYYKMENGKYVEMKGKHGGEILLVENDGHSYELISRDKNGIHLNYCNANGYVERSGLYSDDGNMNPIKVTNYKNGKSVSTSSYTYNQYGSTEKYFEHNAGWKHNRIRYYNNKNQNTGGIMEDGTTKWTTRHFDNGSSFETYTRKDGTKYYWFYPKNRQAYECDANGNPIK